MPSDLYQQRRQLDLFLTPGVSVEKNRSPIASSCAYIDSDFSSQPATTCCFMPSRSPSYPLFDQEETSDSAVNTTPKDVHALPNHRARNPRISSRVKAKASGQQLFTFDDDDAGSGSSPSAPAIDRRTQNRDADTQPAGAQLDGSRNGNRRLEIVDLDSGGSGSVSGSAHPLFEHPEASSIEATPPHTVERISRGEKGKAEDILSAVTLLKSLEHDHRLPTSSERETLARFGGFGPVARHLFPDPITGQYRDASWERLGQSLKSLLSDEEYESAKRTTFNAFYTSPTVIKAMHRALDQLGVAADGWILEPGCGSGNFLRFAPPGRRFTGVELDSLSGRLAQAINPEHDIRIENFRDTKLPDNTLDAVIGNVPFANIRLDHRGTRYSLHDYFFAKSMDALKPGGVLALVTSHFTMDKQNAAIREYLSGQADFIGAIRLPADAFKNEGTKVVTDIVFMRKREPAAAANHVDPDWLKTGTLEVEGAIVPINQYFLNHPEMVLGKFTRKDQLYGDDGFSVASTGDLEPQLNDALSRLPSFAPGVSKLAGALAPAAARFIRPPPNVKISEGSFFIGSDLGIYQMEHGQATPVTHGSTALATNGTMMARRLAALIHLRDAARLVLQSQNESWPESEREATRKSLHQQYDRFVHSYGPINKTTFSETKDGTVIRRMPNLVKFKDDPDAMLVMSLEEYDEVTGLATKAAIFNRDVVGPKATVTSVTSAEQGLLVSLDERGGVDLPFIQSIYHKPEADIVRELGDLIFLNPATGSYETADIYLSGNVREKLAVAEQGGPDFQLHAMRLRSVQPPDVLPGDIDAKLGSPWIPANDIQAFAAELFGCQLRDVSVAHFKKDATWSVEPSFTCMQSVKATSDFGTSRINGTTLLGQALNMKTPVIYDTIQTASGEERVVNADETLAAREKQKEIKEQFKRWIFTDPERTERLVRTYNDTYNNLRPRLFDGSHLAFPGMNQTISLRPHQKNAIWRVMSSGNTLLAHAVGAGKTFTMAAAGMKLKQAGLISKPMYVVPNHMLEQFSREFMQLYPNAHLLVASKDDLSRDRRKFLTAKIASGDWDGIIVTHSSFERIGMSTEYQQAFIREQIQEYEELLKEAASDSGKRHRNIIKTIEKQKANRENMLKELSAEAKKDDGLVFDELGVDHIFIDEAHYFKNLETPTKMDRVAGIQTGGSQRAFDILMKSRFLDQLHPGHGVTFATGTPISNTMVEMYNMQRFLDVNGLKARDIDHFDAWAANFGEVVDTMEIAPDGASLRPRSRFARFNNLPELQQMFRAFADVQTADMLNLPRPRLKSGQPITVSCPMSDAQATLQSELIERYDRIRGSKVDPRVDNALAITTDGRKLALDSRMLQPGQDDALDSKVNELVHNVHDIWKASAPVRGTQLIFCDMGVHPTAWGFSAYHDITHKLIASGIPPEQIASIGDADSDAKKQVLFDKLRSGTVRVLLGSTQKMGTGTNVQKRLVALHHLDAPWKPAEVEQRDGRILRQGNQNEEVAIYRYVTKGSFDAYMWQALETKARFISQIMTGNVNQRSAEDIGGQELSYAEVKAIASGNPAVLTLAEADAEIQRLQILRKNHMDNQFLIRRKLRELPDTIARLREWSTSLNADQATLASRAHAEFEVNDREIHRDEIAKHLEHALLTIPDSTPTLKRFSLGRHHGLVFGIQVTPYGTKDVYLQGSSLRTANLDREQIGARALLNALTRITDTYGERIRATDSDLSLAEQQLADYQARQGAGFADDAYLQQLTGLRDQLRQALSVQAPGESNSPTAALSAAEIAAQIETLKSSHASTPHIERETNAATTEPEQAVTTRIKDRLRFEPEAQLLSVGSIQGNELQLERA